MMNERYPYTNFHEMNLDWILSEIQKLKASGSGDESKIKDLEDQIKEIKQNLILINAKDKTQDEEIDDLKEELEEIKIPLMLKKAYVVPKSNQDFNDVYSVFERRNL